ncbi:MAG: efflux RND transporter periplasmic adaptor subunit [Candidatus Hydrogenedentes bacterium]|nr:efflux RND transporter periplasmic adaptor subunit [Candidatus Hydrogenedentota bacterium]
MHRARYSILLLTLLFVAVGCSGDRDDKVDAKIDDTPIKSVALVEAELPVHRDISEYLSETSRIAAENQVEVLAKGTGHCLSIKVEEGDTVRKGQVLAELDRAEMEAQVRQSRVNVAQQKIAYERAERGVKQGIVSDEVRDNARFSYEQAKASLEVQEVQLSFLTIRAPIGGIVTKRTLQEGMLVSSGTAAFTIVDPTSYVLPININERHLPRLRVGQLAYVTIDSAGDQEFVTKVRRINPSVDLQSSAIKVILDFDKKDRKYLREAAFARYRLVMDTREDALAVPKDAIIEENTRRYVMLVKEGTPATDDSTVDGDDQSTPESESVRRYVATRMEVEVGLEDSDYTEILSGIKADDLVITLGQQTVNDGDDVEVTTIENALDAKAALNADEALEEAKKKAPAESDARQGRRRQGPHGR